MAAFRGKFNSVKQDWETPDEVIAPLRAEFRFTLDAAASAKNKKASRFFCAKSNGLAQDWSQERVWVNPPYGDRRAPLRAWVKKAHEESTKGALVVMLIPARTNTGWFHDICLKHGEVRFIRGRPKFGNGAHGLPQPLCLVVFRPRI